MGDRYLINQTASNIFLNIYASNGIVGLILLLYLKLIIIKKIYYFFIFKKKENDYKHIKLISLLLLIFFMMRSILETSYGIFGIDFILFCLASNLITLNYSK
jgi:O-antigen ligase